METRKTIFVGLSGGVDSAVSAKRLLDAGHTVVGVFIRVWHPEFLTCNAEAERLDAMRIAAHLKIPFRTFDAEEAYKKEVGEYMIEMYRKGTTPNPDVMCNQHVKFGAFLDFALKEGADGIATGHYARMVPNDGTQRLFRGKDREKDQSYFLWTLTANQRVRVMFPVGDSLKSDVRKEAQHAGIPVFDKPDSQGICFLGHVNLEEFLGHYIETKSGDVLDEAGNRIGTHAGAIYYTLGQRHGFTNVVVGKESTPHYVVSKNIEENTITVSPHPRTVVAERDTIKLVHCNCMRPLPVEFLAQFRYRQKPFRVRIQESSAQCVILTVLDEGIDVPSVGQSCVLYDGDECLGGGIIS